MRILSALLLVCISSSALAIFNTNGDLDTNAGLNYQAMFTQKSDELVAFTATCNAKYAEFNSQITGLQSQLKNAVAAINDSVASNKQLTSDLADAKLKVASIEGLNFQIKSLTDVNGQLNVRITKYETDMQKMAAQYADANKQIDTYKANAAQYTAQISALNLTITSSQKTAADYRAQIDQLNATIATLNISKDNEAKYKQQLTDMQNQMSSVNKAYSDLYTKYSAQGDAMAKMQAELDAKKGQEAFIATLNAAIADYKAKLGDNDKTIAGLNVQITKITADLNSQNADWTNQVTVLKAQVAQYTKDNADLKTANASFSAAIADLQIKLRQIDTLNAQVSSLNAQLTTAGNDNKALNDQINRLYAQISSLNAVSADNKNLQVKIDSLNVQITTLTQSNSDCAKKTQNLETISKKLYADLQNYTGKNSSILIGQSLNADY